VRHLGLVDVVDADGLQHLRLDEVADARLGHDGDRHGGLDAVDHVRVAHPGDAAVAPDVGRHALERHDGDRAGVLGDAGLLGVDDVHDDAALEHLGHAALDAVGAQRGRGSGAVGGHQGFLAVVGRTAQSRSAAVARPVGAGPPARPPGRGRDHGVVAGGDTARERERGATTP
jgi:hypothetical protein